MNSSIIVAIYASVAAGLVVGCATIPPASPKVQIVTSPSKALGFSDIRVRDNSSAFYLNGTVLRRNRMVGPVPGHVHIELYANGKQIAWADSRWSRFLRKSQRSSQFFLKIPLDSPAIDEIRVTHMTTAHTAGRKSG